MKHSNMKRLNAKGFTLIELVIVMAIVGILAALAYPSYQEYLRKGYRAQAKSSLLQAAQLMERYYTSNNTYPGTLALAGIPTYAGDSPGSSKYVISLPVTGANAYELRAAPNFTDNNCNVYGYTSVGVKTASGSLGAATPSYCW